MPCKASGRSIGGTVRASAGSTVSAKVADADWGFGLPESVTVTVMLDVPLVVGVPAITPVSGSRESPSGNDPLETAKVSAPTPPDAVIAWPYAEFWAACASEDVEMLSAEAAATVKPIASVTVCGVPDESVTVTVADPEPTAVGVPLIVPVCASSVSPAGRAPEVTLKEYGLSPPDGIIDAR